MRRLTTVALVVAAMLALGTAAGAASPAPGKYTSTLSGQGSKTEGGALDGTWTIDFAGSGEFSVSWNGSSLKTSHYTISGSEITFSPGKGHKCTTKATYSYALHASTLRLTAVTDTCTLRRDVLTYGPWTKIG